jgi:hypothetical protein
MADWLDVWSILGKEQGRIMALTACCVALSTTALGQFHISRYGPKHNFSLNDYISIVILPKVQVMSGYIYNNNLHINYSMARIDFLLC